MLKHIVEVSARSPHEVVVEYTITDGHRQSHAQEIINPMATPDAYLVERELVTFHRLVSNYIVRITNLDFHNKVVVRDLKRQATDHFHGEVVTEYRMNER